MEPISKNSSSKNISPFYKNLKEEKKFNFFFYLKLQNIGTKFDVSCVKQFITPMFESLQCGNRTAMNAAGFAITELRKHVGKELFDELLSDEQKSTLQNNQYIIL